MYMTFVEGLPLGKTLEMIKVPEGSFLMGTEQGEVIRLCQEYSTDWFEWEHPQHKVSLNTFYLGKDLVTQEQYEAVMGKDKNLSNFKDNPLNPVDNVSWDDVQEFCRKLNDITGKQYRLPTEAEWEYACRGGTTTAFNFGEIISTDLANYNGNYLFGTGTRGSYREKTTPLGSFPENKFGLRDMHGNLWEWCCDGWHENYNGAPTDGSAWHDSNNYRRGLHVLRGGSWYNNPRSCRSANRNRSLSDFRLNFYGFRLAASTL